jgi:hypothetical protein
MAQRVKKYNKTMTEVRISSTFLLQHWPNDQINSHISNSPTPFLVNAGVFFNNSTHLAYALGFYHEQSRWGRDFLVHSIQTQNLLSDFPNQFLRLSLSLMTSFGIQQVGQICRIPCIGTISGFSV